MNYLFENIEYEVLNKGLNFEIRGIEYDSRKIENNYVFCALIGSISDGHDYIEKAINLGAKLIIVEKRDISILDYNVTYIYINDLRSKLGIIASNYYNYPQNNLTIIGITGTNGKTTTSYILESVLEKTSRIGTTGYKILDEELPSINTTPESLDLIKIIDFSNKKGVENFIMEVSSHALKIGRVNMLKFDVAMFTNLSQDHLDFHNTMEDYFLSKKKLFTMLKNKDNGVVNIDDIYGKKIYLENNKFISYSIKDRNADLYGEVLSYSNKGMRIRIIYNNIEKESMVKEIDIKFIGNYNVHNILGSIGVLLKLGYDFDYIINKLNTLEPVPGRFELIDENQDYTLVVDYAHTPDAIENILHELREITKNKIITVFGAGGDRDKTKRHIMGIHASKYSDYIILTSDNPRTEDPMKILSDIEEGLKEVNYPLDKYEIIEDRESAIKKAIEIAKTDDAVLIAGKGHEDYQIIGTEKIHFDDREMARKYIK